MRNLLSVVLLLALHTSLAHAQQTMADLWRAMPDTIVPILSHNNRYDMVDFIDNHMEARVTNQLEGKSIMDTLTADYLHITLTPQTVIEMKALPDGRILMARTAAGISTELHIYNKEWKEQPMNIAWPQIDHYLDGAEIAADLRARIVDAASVIVRLSADTDELTYTLCIDDLQRDDKEVLRPLLKPVVKH